MRISIKAVTIYILISITTIVHSQSVFTKGVNLTGWFDSNGINQLQFTKYSKQDLKNIKSLGADVIRLPLNLTIMTNGAPDYVISPLFFQFLDSAVSWAEDLQIHLILDNHTFDPNINTPLNFDIPLRKEWIQMANHYKNRSNYILYEVLNEPHGPSTAQWCKMQKTVIDTIRTVDTKHTIVVGASGYNSYTELKNMTIYSDTNLIYTFHFYDPMVFTHQGASWLNPPADSLKGVPFPYNDSTMPVCPPTLKGSWLESNLNQYATIGTDSSVRSLIDIAVAFQKQKNVRLYCGEYGVFNINSNNIDRVHWYNTVRTHLEENNIPWTTWDYQDGFGLFIKGSNEQFDYDVNIPLVQTLGFNVPPQMVYKKEPDSVGFPVYTDYLAKNIFDNSWIDSSALAFYNNQRPNNGSYSILFQDTAQYSGISLKFSPVKDLSLLKTNQYAIDLMVRCTNPGAQFEIRFVDNKTTDTSTHSWRMSYELTSSVVAFDSLWHHVRIPFKNMNETGAWDGVWSNPRGQFDWTSVGYLEIRNEQKALPSHSKLWLDNIVVTNLDTAHVFDTTKLVETPITYSKNEIATLDQLKIYPNPLKQQTTISYRLIKDANVEVTIFNTLGQKVYSQAQTKQAAGLYSTVWEPAGYSNGLYICRIVSEDVILSKIIVVDKK